MMRNSLKRVLDRLRNLGSGRKRPATSIRTGLQEPQRAQSLLPVPVRARSQR